MNQDEIFKIIGILIVSFFIIHIVVKMFHLQTSVIEGLTNKNVKGQAGTAGSYADSIKSQVVKLQDELLISKYRKDYEASIIHLDDYIGYSMLKLSLNFKMSENLQDNIENIKNLNALNDAKKSLNDLMKYLDKQ
jgi:hypothetical protein